MCQSHTACKQQSQDVNPGSVSRGCGLTCYVTPITHVASWHIVDPSMSGITIILANFFFFLFWSFVFLRAAPVACGSSQARVLIGAVAESLLTFNPFFPWRKWPSEAGRFQRGSALGLLDQVCEGKGVHPFRLKEIKDGSRSSLSLVRTPSRCPLPCCPEPSMA